MAVSRRRVLFPLLIGGVALLLLLREHSLQRAAEEEVARVVAQWCEDLPQTLPVADRTIAAGLRDALGRVRDAGDPTITVSAISGEYATHEAMLAAGDVTLVVLVRRSSAGIVATGYR